MKGCAAPCSRLPNFEFTHQLIYSLIHVKAPNFSGTMMTFTNEHMPQDFDSLLALCEGG